MKRSLSIAFASFLVLILTATVLAVLLAPPNQDPLAGKVQVLPDGQVRISGGVSGDQWKQIQARLNPPRNYTYYELVTSAYPTMAWKGTIKDIPRSGQVVPSGYDAAQSFGKGLQAFWDRYFGPAPDWGELARGAAGWLFGLFTSNGAAACGAGGGTCYRITSGDNWNTANSWSASSGGASCGAACVPAATDAVVVDAGSPAGTVTLVAPVTVASLQMALSAIQFNTGANNFTVSGTTLISLGGISAASVSPVILFIGDVTINGTGYLVLGNGIWKACGVYSNSTTSASWSTAGSSSFLFVDQASRTLTFDGANLTNEFATVQFGYTAPAGCTNAGAPITYTFSGALHVGGGSVNTITVNAPAVGVTVAVGANTIAASTAAFTTNCANACAFNLGGSAASFAAVTVGTNATLGGSSSTITVNGNWDSSAGANTTCNGQVVPGFGCGSSTVDMAANGSAKTDGVIQARFWNWNVNNNISVSLLSNIAVWNSISIGGAAGGTVSGAFRLALTNGTSFTVGAGVTAITCAFEWLPSGVAVLPGISYGAFLLDSASAVTLGGNVTTTSVDPGNTWGIVLEGTLNTDAAHNYSLSVNGGYGVYISSDVGTGVLVSNASTVTLTGYVILVNAANYISNTGGNWTVSGYWTNASTSASWSFVANITFNSSSNQNITPGNLAQEFSGNMIFNSGASTVTFTLLTRALKWGGTLTVQGGVGVTTLATSNLALTGGALAIANSGSLTANASTVSVSTVTMTGAASGTLTLTSALWTVTGNWDSSGAGATFTYGTSTVNFTQTGNISVNGGNARTFYNLQVAANAKTTTVNQNVIYTNVLTFGTGTVTDGGSGAILYELGTAAAPLSNGGATIQIMLEFDRQGAMSLPALTSSKAVEFTMGGIGGAAYTITLTGALSCGAILFGNYSGSANAITLNTSLTDYSVTATSLSVGVNPTTPDIFVANDSAVVISGSVTVTATSYITSTASGAWTVSGAWTDNSTSAAWSFAAPILFNSASNAIMRFGGTGLPVPEFINATFDTTNAAAQIFFTMSNALIVSGILAIQDTASAVVGHSVVLDVSASNYQITAGTVHLNADCSAFGGGNCGNSGMLQGRSATILTTNWIATNSGYNNDCFPAPFGCSSAAVVEIQGAGTLTTKNAPASSGDFWKLTIMPGATATLNNTAMLVVDILTVDGSLLAGTPTVIGNLETAVWGASGTLLNIVTPVVIGVGGDVSQSGFIEINYRGTGVTYNIQGGTYQQLGVFSQNGAQVTANQLGDIATNFVQPDNPCVNWDQPGANVPATNCELIINSYNAGFPIIYNTNDHNINFGIMFLGDTTNEDVIFNSGASHVICHEMGLGGTASVLNLQTSTWDVYPSPLYTPVAWIQEFQTVVNGGTATVNIHGEMRFWPAAPLSDTSHLNSQGATFNILADGSSGSCAAVGYLFVFAEPQCPGDVRVDEAPLYIDFGTSTWNVAGSWYSVSTSASWSVGSGATIDFTGAAQTIEQNGTHDGFPATMFSGSYTLASTMATQSLTVAAGGTLTANAYTITVNGNWDDHLGTFNYGTSTVVISATASVTTANLAGGENFYNFTVNAGVTATLTSSVGVGNVVTANGVLRIGSAAATTLFILDNAGITDPVVIGGGGSITTARPIAELATLYFFTHAGTRVNIPSAVYTNLRIAFSPINPVAGFGVEYRIAGDITASSMVWVSRAGRPYFVNSQTFNVTLNMPVVSGPSLSDSPVDTGVKVGIQATGGTWTLGTVTLNTAGEVNFYIKFGASNWFISGAYDNSVTTDAADWSAGSGTVTFNATNGALLAFGGNGLGSTPEFHNVTVDPNVAGNPGFIMGGPLVISGTFFLQNSAFGGHFVSFDVSASNYQLTADTVHLSDTGNNAIFQARQGTIKTRNWTSITSNYLPTCFAAPFPGCASAATVEFYGTGTIDAKGGGSDFWNMVIDAGAVTTFVGKFPNTDVSFGIDVANQATVNGTLIADHASPQWPLVTFTVHAWTTATPIVIGAGGDASDSGFFIVGYTGNLPAISLAGGAYSAISLQIPAATTVNQAGDISTNHANCIVSATQCEFIMATYAPFPAPFFRYNTNNFALNVGGEMILGDLNNDGVNFYAGSSVISVYGFAPIENATVYLQTATLNLYPSMNYRPTAWIQERQAVVYAGSATINIHGVLRLWPFGNPGDNTALYAQSATFNLLAQDAFSGPCTPLYGCPGDVRVDEAGYFIDFGSSTWNIAGGWRSTSASASWNAGTATLNFNGTGTILPTPGAIALPEFSNVRFGNGSAYTVASMTFTSMTADVAASLTMNAFAVWGMSMSTSAGYILLDQWLAFDRGTSIKWHFAPSAAAATITIVVSATTAGGYTLYRDGVSVQQAVMTPGTASFTLTGGWSPHTMEVRPQSSTPAQVLPAPSGFAFTCDQGAIDWLNPIASSSTVTVTFIDGSGLAPTATQYVWNFDDGTPAVVTTGNTVTHTFKAGRVYAVQVDVVYASGAATYIFSVDARGANCSLQVFVRTMVVPLYVAGAAFAVAGAVALLAQRRSKNPSGRLFKALVALAVAAFVVPLAIYVYAYLAGIPIGG